MLLHELPYELLHEIFWNLSTEELLRTVRLVCQRFNCVLLHGLYWNRRVQARYHIHLPARLRQHGELDPDFVEARRSRAAERIIERWRDTPAFFAAPTTASTHYATVDAITQFRCVATHKPMCVSGARDRNIILWDVNAMKKKAPDDASAQGWIAASVDNAHEGWIWQVCTNADNSKLFSAGWDGRLKQWSLAESEIKPLDQLRLAQNIAVLSCLNDGQHLIYVSTFNAGPIACDTRTGLSIVASLKVHSEQPVFNIATGSDTNYVYSLGEDMRLVMVDKRWFIEPVLSRAVGRISRMAFCDGYLMVGMRKGLLCYLDPTTLKAERSIWVETDSNEPPREQRANHFCVAPSAGALCCSYGQKIKLYTPGLAPKRFASYETDALITQISCNEDAIVCGSGTGTMRFWRNIE